MDKRALREELHERVSRWRTGVTLDNSFYSSLEAQPIFSFWKATLHSTSTWTTAGGEFIALDDLDDSHLMTIWNYMGANNEFLSLVWVSDQGDDPVTAHRELPPDWLETTPIMEALAWELHKRGMVAPPLPHLTYEAPQELSWEDMVE